ncbi:MAG TPA: SelB C-terminal domain-containing protein [Candidatus Aminicenantes bacterium]|nr:SelB C-terminal domain-containing protein [Candidatus Aminicenantes bacterium]
MKVSAFDAVLDGPFPRGVREFRAEAVFLGGSAAARLTDYAFAGRRDRPFARIEISPALDVRWSDPFELRAAGATVARGACLFPDPPPPDGLSRARRKDLLARLALGEKDMVLALAEADGLEGLQGGRLASFARLSASRVEELARALETEGRVRILSFDPLRLIAEDGLAFLRGRIVAFLARYHKTHSNQRGAPREKLEARFDTPRAVLVLALRLLAKEGRIVEDGGSVRLPDFHIPLAPGEEETLAALEKRVLGGDPGAVSLDEIRAELGLAPGKLQTLLAVLAERKKIVEGPDGFIIHRDWLDGIVRKLRASGRKELTVAEFKALTGLSRKYSIPLLELLDSMGVTRRKGSVRDIL